MRIITPYPPSVNRYYRNGKRGSKYISPAGKAFVHTVRGGNLGRTPLSGPVCVTVWYYRPRKSGDIDNPLKALLDALEGVAYDNDRQVVELHAYRLDDKANPRAEVWVTPVTPARDGLRKHLRHKQVGIRSRFSGGHQSIKS